MKRFLTAVALLGSLAFTQAGVPTTIDTTNKYAYGANIGWVNWYGRGPGGDIPSGAVIGEYVCSGYIYAANVGWISLGNGSPVNRIQYQNNAINDFGVNNDGLGNLRGYAYGQNIGWINFENIGAPAVNLRTGQLSGYVWSANCGWISLSNSFAYVQTDTIYPGALDTNGLPIAWEMQYFGQTGVDPNADPDGDGMSNMQEYLAGTNPLDASSDLKIISFDAMSGGASSTVEWNSAVTRQYYLEETLSLGSPSWFDSGLGLISPDGSTTTRVLNSTNAPERFYRVRAVLPLSQ